MPEAELCMGYTDSAGRQADQSRVGYSAIAARQRSHQRLFGRAGECRQAPVSPRCPRESWPQPVHLNVARRLTVADFIALAPNALTSLGGYLGDDEQGLARFSKLNRAKMTEDFLAAANWL